MLSRYLLNGYKRTLLREYLIDNLGFGNVTLKQ